MNENVRALYDKIMLPGVKQEGEDDQTFSDRVRQSENLLNQNFLTIQQQMAEIRSSVTSLEDWAKQVGG